jgi:hypothetical protein
MTLRRASSPFLAAVMTSLLACAPHATSSPSPAVAGTLRYSGKWTHTRARGTAAEWLVYSFEARVGDRVTAFVRSSSGAPVARLVDGAQRLLADSVIDHPDGDTIAGAGFAVSTTGTYFLLLRDRSDPNATFEVQLNGAFACERDADCERAGEATGDPKRPSALDQVPSCRIAEGATRGECKSMLRGE